MSVHYSYVARTAQGRTTRGAIEAASPGEALDRLRGRKLTPLSVSPATTGARAGARLGDRDARDLARTLAQLLKSGLPLAEALRFAGEELQGSAAAAATRLREAAERGERPSVALQGFHGPQARLLSGVMLAGETSGKLPESLDVAALAFERAAELRARAATSLIYPGFVLLATVATLAAFVFFVVPTIAGAFEGGEARLPASTRRLLAVSAWLRGHVKELALAIAATVGLVAGSPAARRVLAAGLDRLLGSPIGFGIAPRLDLAAFAGLAALSIDAGVPAGTAFDAAAAGVRGQRLQGRLKEVALAIRLGERPSAAVQRLARPPRALVRLMQVGEETGGLGIALKQAAELLTAEAEQRLQRLGAVAGPIVTMALGGMVASVVLSLFLGLLAMSDVAAG